MVPKVAILTGPTASGKSQFALEICASQNPPVEIINADSMTVYKDCDIGTAKPTYEERTRVPHHLFDIRSPDQPFTAGEFSELVHAQLEKIHQTGRRAVIVGGTGFYLKALLTGMWPSAKSDPTLRRQLEALDPQEVFNEVNKIDASLAAKIGHNDHYRLVRALEVIRLTGKSPKQLEAEMPQSVAPNFVVWIVDRQQGELEKRIVARTRQMLKDGLIDETKKLMDQYPNSRVLNAVGYAETVRYLKNEVPAGRKIRPGIEGLEDEIVLGTRQLVKRQRTWFRGQTQGQWFVLESDRGNLLKAWHELYG